MTPKTEIERNKIFLGSPPRVAQSHAVVILTLLVVTYIDNSQFDFISHCNLDCFGKRTDNLTVKLYHQPKPFFSQSMVNYFPPCLPVEWITQMDAGNGQTIQILVKTNQLQIFRDSRRILWSMDIFINE